MYILRKKIIFAVFILLCFLPAPLLFSVQTPAGQKQVMNEVRIEQRLGAKVPQDLAFLDENGKTVLLGDYFKKKPVLITPVYYECPMLCSLILSELLNTLKVMRLSAGKDFDILTFSIDPKETPALALAKKNTYVKTYARPGAAEGWHFLTGDEASIKKLTDSLGFFYAYDKTTQQYAHPATVILTTADGVLTHYFAGIGTSPRDLRLGIVEASRGKVGTPMDQILLMCYHYDPETGKYGLVITRTIRIAGVLTLVLLFTGILLLFKHERRTQVPHGNMGEK